MPVRVCVEDPVTVSVPKDDVIALPEGVVI